MKVLYEDNHVIIVEKPCNIPVQADSSHDPDMASLVKEYLVEKYRKPGSAYLGIVSRLDRPAGGVLLFAKTSKAASRLAGMLARREGLQKDYLAVIDSPALPPCGEYIDYLKKDPKTRNVFVARKGEEGAKLSELSYERLSQNRRHSLALVHLKTGRPHQIRVQFSSRRFPLWGDQRYNALAKPGEQLALWSYRLSFEHPVSRRQITVRDLPEEVSVWKEFSGRFPQ